MSNDNCGPLVNDHIQQLAVLEEKVQRHEGSIGSLDISISSLTTELRAIKNISIGVLLALLANTIGLLDLIKAIILKG